MVHTKNGAFQRISLIICLDNQERPILIPGIQFAVYNGDFSGSVGFKVEFELSRFLAVAGWGFQFFQIVVALRQLQCCDSVAACCDFAHFFAVAGLKNTKNSAL